MTLRCCLPADSRRTLRACLCGTRRGPSAPARRAPSQPLRRATGGASMTAQSSLAQHCLVGPPAATVAHCCASLQETPSILSFCPARQPNTLVKTTQEGHVAEGGGGAGAVGPQAGHGGEGEDIALPVCSSLTRGRCRTAGERISSVHGIASSCYAGAQEHRWRTCLVWYSSSS